MENSLTMHISCSDDKFLNQIKKNFTDNTMYMEDLDDGQALYIEGEGNTSISDLTRLSSENPDIVFCISYSLSKDNYAVVYHKEIMAGNLLDKGISPSYSISYLTGVRDESKFALDHFDRLLLIAIGKFEENESIAINEEGEQCIQYVESSVLVVEDDSFVMKLTKYYNNLKIDFQYKNRIPLQEVS